MDTSADWQEIAWASFCLPAVYSALEAEAYAMLQAATAVASLSKGRLDDQTFEFANSADSIAA